MFAPATLTNQSFVSPTGSSRFFSSHSAAIVSGNYYPLHMVASVDQLEEVDLYP